MDIIPAILAFSLIMSASAATEPVARNAVALLNHSAWTEIGPGRKYAQLKPAEIARLQRCDGASMYFEHWPGRSFDQVFMSGISMRDTFERVELAQSGSVKIIMLFRTAKSAKPDETLYLSGDGKSLTQVVPPASPHVYLRCESPEIKMR
jgi:hypothetical protein